MGEQVEDLRDRVIIAETMIKQLTSDMVILKNDYSSLDKRQNKTDIEITEIKGDIKTILGKIDALTDRWNKWDEQQKDNANKIKLQTIFTIIAVIGAFVATAVGLK